MKRDVSPRALGAGELHLRDAEYGTVYTTVPTLYGSEGIAPALQPAPHILRVVRKALPIKLRRRIMGAADKAACGVGGEEIINVPSDKHCCRIYNPFGGNWFGIILPGETIISTNITRVALRDRPQDIHALGDGRVRWAARRHAANRRVQNASPKPAPDGRRVFVATIGNKKSLRDAANFDFVVDVHSGEKAKDAATRVKRVLVGAAAAGLYARSRRAGAWRAGFKAQIASWSGTPK